MTDPQVSELGKAIQEVTDKVGLLVREEIALAQAEMTEKISKLIRGIAAGVVAGIFALFGLIYLLHSLSWGVWELLGHRQRPVARVPDHDAAAVPVRRDRRPARVPLHQEGDAAQARDGDRGGPADPRDRRGHPAAGHRGAGDPPLMAARSPEEIRRSIEANRAELGMAVEKLRQEVAVVTDWRSQLRANQKNIIIGAAVAGFVIGGGIAGVGRLLRRR